MHADLSCTYRLQLSLNFTFRDAAGLLGYLRDLGISHVYLSPLLKAEKGSQHGYDVIDPTIVNPELGGETELAGLFEKLRERNMGAVLDIVPNHVAVSADNPWWWDVLKNGRSSEFAPFLDISWNDGFADTTGRLVLPVLADHPGNVIESGELRIETTAGNEPVIRYGEQRFPINAEGLELLKATSWDLGDVLDCQHYRLAYWQVAAEDINYRRFFDVQSLIGVKMETEAVFETAHRKLFELVASGPVDGIRIDHPDGLRDPAEYFTRLRAKAGPLWLTAEKILEPGEALPTQWPIDGTTGYDFLQRVGGLFVDPAGEKSISDFYSDFTRNTEPFGTLVRNKKRSVIDLFFGSDVRRLVDQLRLISRHRNVRRDYSRKILRELLTDLLAGFPTYRSYVNRRRGEFSEADREAIKVAISSARRREPPYPPDLLEFLEAALCGELEVGEELDEFIARFQQLTGPVMAKGVEDTTFYCYDRLLALNEVGCDPARFGVSAQAFHEACVISQRDWPSSMLGTSTHDTKRSEDVRSRIALLSEIPDRWAEQVRVWSLHNMAAWKGRVPDRSAEHLLYQTLVGAWPIEVERIEQYMLKACREAKTGTTWLDPDPDYEARILDFTRTLVTDPEFIKMLETFIEPLVPLGRINSLAQTLLKLTVPGIPDIYQGCEIWDNSLVDPDNRRPVDYDSRRKLLADLDAGLSVEEITRRSSEGLPKLHVIRTALALRKRRPDCFGSGAAGAYQPLLCIGSKLRHVLAFRRGAVAVVVPRLVAGLDGEWDDTQVDLGPGKWRNLLDGKMVEGAVNVACLLNQFPVALLESIDA